jgi:UDP-N-acetylmuramoylalanine--D-glutamate ligase
MSAYIEAKRHITRFQNADDWFIVNRNDHDCWESRSVTSAHVVPFGFLHAEEDGAGVEHGHLYWQRAGIRSPLIDADEIPLPGDHVVSNALAASAAALLGGAKLHDVRVALREAHHVPHRQEHIATVNGVDYINDTTATAPAAAIAALETFHDREIVLLAGGAGKKANLQRFAELAARRAAWIVLLDGEETPRLSALLTAAGAENIIGPVSSMDEAVHEANAKAQSGSVVLLSPGCASFGLFRDEFDRGDQFRSVVTRLVELHGDGGAA